MIDGSELPSAPSNFDNPNYWNNLNDMALTNVNVAEEALALPPTERADLAKLLIHSLEDDPRTDAEIKANLSKRLDDLITGRDAGLTFQETFGSPQ
jgi:putative addiction module component (TIGR02574 family)